MTAAVDAPTAEQQEIADVILRCLADLELPAEHVPLAAACAVLGRPWLADALQAARETPALRRTVDTLRLRHTPVPVAPGEARHVCAFDRIGWPCPDGAVLWEIDE